jgi:hypothetical protein
MKAALTLALLLLAGQARAEAKLARPSAGSLSKRFPGKKRVSAYVSPYLLEYGGLAPALIGDCEGALPAGLSLTRGTVSRCPKSDGTLVTLGSHLPVLTSRGLRRMPTATNLMLRNSELTTAPWTSSNGTVGAIALTANAGPPLADGTTTAERLVIPAVAATGEYAQHFQSFTGSATSYTFSAWIRGVSGSGTTRMRFHTGPSTSAGVVTCSYNASTYTLCSTTATLTATTWLAVIGHHFDYGGAASAADVYIAETQVEVGSSATMPIATGGTTATRNADVYSTPTPAGLSTTEGCAYVCYEPTVTSHAATQLILDGQGAATGTWGGRAWLFYAVTTSVGAHNSINAPSVAGAFTVGTNRCYLSTWSVTANQFRVTNLSTSTVGAATAFGGMGPFGANLFIGSQTGGSAGINGYLTALRLGTSPTGCQL